MRFLRSLWLRVRCAWAALRGRSLLMYDNLLHGRTVIYKAYVRNGTLVVIDDHAIVVNVIVEDSPGAAFEIRGREATISR